MTESLFLHVAKWCYRRRWITVGYAFQCVHDHIGSRRFRRLLRRYGYGSER